MSKLVVGCGYLGLRVAHRWRDAGEVVHAVTRSKARADLLRSDGLRPWVADVTDPASLADLPAVESVLYAVGYDRSAGKSMHEVYVAGLTALLDALPGTVRRILYISSTSVYGQLSGEWIDEASERAPITAGGRVCLAAEQALEQHPLSARAGILRLAGIYGPERIPRRQAIEEGEPIAAAPDAYLNLIHVDDAVAAVVAAEQHPSLEPALLVSDGTPVIRREYYREFARLWGCGEPQFAEPVVGQPPAGRGATDKRVANRRLLEVLKLNLKYPSYREGLAAIRAVERP